MIQRNRFLGSLIGLATGDALGTTLEFRAPGTFTPISDLVGGGPFGLRPGQWTDDTSMALCLAASLVGCGRYDPADQMQRYVRWYRQGYMSSTGRCFDIGNTVRAALQRFEQTGEPYSGSTHPNSAGNGSLMRLAPVPLFFAGNPREAVEKSGDSSRTTHGAAAAVDACRYYGGLLAAAVHGVSKEELLSPGYCPADGMWDSMPLVPEIEEIAQGSFKRREPPEIVGSGYVVRSMEAALWSFFHSNSFHDGCLLAANLGDDADTTAAIYGQLAGAYYGLEGIPQSWLERVAMRQEIGDLAERLFELAGASTTTA